MRFENTRVYNFENAFRGMRNPMNSWDKSDSIYDDSEYGFVYNDGKNSISIGPNDLDLAKRLIKAGSMHRKFLRQIFISVDITAPLFFWKEADQHKVATTTNSTSTMHKLTSRPIKMTDFEMDDYNFVPELNPDGERPIPMVWNNLIIILDTLRLKYLQTKDKKYWKELIRLLPESYLQKRTWTCSYETLLNICAKDSRRNHKLNEWSGVDNPNLPNFIAWCRLLPYAHEFLFPDETKEEFDKAFVIADEMFDVEFKNIWSEWFLKDTEFGNVTYEEYNRLWIESKKLY